MSEQAIQNSDGPAPAADLATRQERIWKFRPQELIALLGLLVYANTQNNPFVFDSILWIPQNPAIRKLWPIWDVLTSQNRQITRPLVNLSLAINYAVSGLKPWSYHAFNAVVHILAGITLYAVVRRTLTSERFKGLFAAAAMPLAFVVAILWTVHPLTTAAVSYTIQRAESMMGLFYLLTLYCAIRTAAAPGEKKWPVLAVVVCAAGMASKQVMVTAPLVVLAWDRIFAARSFKEVFRRRWAMYLGLAASWVVLAPSLGRAFTGGQTAGFGLEAVTATEYAATQFGVICHYLRLCFWPAPLVLDYGWPVARSVGQIVPYAACIGVLALATVAALWKRPAWGFLGLLVFLVLSPSSSVLPIEDLAAEQRMYLPLTAVVAGAVITAYLIGRALPGGRRLAVVVVAALTLALGYATHTRNADYRRQLTIWQDVVAKRPENPRGWYNLATVRARAEQWDRAEPMYRKAVELRGDYAEAHLNLGNVLWATGQTAEAATHYKLAIRHKDKLEGAPKLDSLYVKLGDIAARQGKYAEAAGYYRKALEVRPDHAAAAVGLARVRRLSR